MGGGTALPIQSVSIVKVILIIFKFAQSIVAPSAI